MRQRQLFVITFLVCLLLGGCGGADHQSSSSNQAEDHSPNVDSLEKQTGIVASIEKPNKPNKDDVYADQYRILVIPDIDDIDVSDKTIDELENLARENDGAYYYVHPDLYDEQMDLGTKLTIYWSGQCDSDPPVRDAEKIKVIVNQGTNATKVAILDLEADMEGIVIDVTENGIKLARELSPDAYEEIKNESVTKLHNDDVAGKRYLGLIDLIYETNNEFNKGDEVEVWIDGDIMEIYPPRAIAKKILLKE